MSEEFVRRVISRYYKQAEFDIKSIAQREFGVGSTKKIDARHLSFATTDELKNFLVANAPLFVSHSAAYYRYPAAVPMEKKERIAADLIFDLDLHTEGKYDVYAKLGVMKEEVIKLIEDFLIADFGLSKKDILAAFSGNRGYHIHVRNDDFATLGSDERREIMNYVRGEGLNIKQFFEWKETSGRQKQLIGPTPFDGGYRGRLAALVLKEPMKISRIFADQRRKEHFVEEIKHGNWSGVTLRLDELLERVEKLKYELIIRAVNADPAVTYDLSKLIRVPNSIHGETGFVAKIVNDINTFEPLRHAVINGPEVGVLFREAVPSIEMLGETIGPFVAEQRAELPLGAAMFFLLKKSAELIS
ncbi:MAG: DNA primase catalytic subunit PriS [Candidatus Bilamarchaeaceae archaeon]